MTHLIWLVFISALIWKQIWTAVEFHCLKNLWFEFDGWWNLCLKIALSCTVVIVLRKWYVIFQDDSSELSGDSDNTESQEYFVADEVHGASLVKESQQSVSSNYNDATFD